MSGFEHPGVKRTLTGLVNALRLKHLNDLTVLSLRAVSLAFAAPDRSQVRPGGNKFSYSVVSACPAHRITAVRSGLAYVRPIDDMHAEVRPSTDPRSIGKIWSSRDQLVRCCSIIVPGDPLAHHRPTLERSTKGCSDSRSHRTRIGDAPRERRTSVSAPRGRCSPPPGTQTRGWMRGVAGPLKGAGGTTGSGTSGRRRR